MIFSAGRFLQSTISFSLICHRTTIHMRPNHASPSWPLVLRMGNLSLVKQTTRSSITTGKSLSEPPSTSLFFVSSIFFTLPTLAHWDNLKKDRSSKLQNLSEMIIFWLFTKYWIWQQCSNCQQRHPKTLQSKAELTQIDIQVHKPGFDFHEFSQILWIDNVLKRRKFQR